MHAVVDGGGDDLVGGEADAVIDHFKAHFAGPDGDLLGAVGMTVEPRLAHQEFRGHPKLAGER